MTPLTLADTPMQVVESDHYLGDQLSKNLTESVHQTVKRRVGLASQSVYEIRAVVDDARAEAVGRLTVGFTIWETSVISMLLHNSEVWTEVGRKTIKLLDQLQLKYLRLVTGVGTGCPIPILLYHTGTLSMSNRILLRKILFCFHLATLPPGTLARDTFDMMVQNDHVGHWKEIEPLLRDFGLGPIQSYSKYQFRKIVKAKIIQKQKQELLKMSEKYKKIRPEDLGQVEFEVQDYFKTLTVSQSRLRFRLFARMTPRVAMCWKGVRMYREREYQCLAHREAGEAVTEENRDTEEHVLNCPYYAHMASDLALDTHQGIVTYFQRVISSRAELEKYIDENEYLFDTVVDY